MREEEMTQHLKRFRIEFTVNVHYEGFTKEWDWNNEYIKDMALQELECMSPCPLDITFSEVIDIQPLHDSVDLFERAWRAKEMLAEADEKQLLEEVERRLELAEIKGNQGKISPIWHTFKDWNDAPDCECVLVTIENKFGQRFVTDAWWVVDCECRCQWHTNDIKYAEDWEAGDFHLSHNWKVVAWRYRLEPYKEDYTCRDMRS